MEINTAADLFRHRDFNVEGKTNWADLGCGTGTFTMALANLLPHKSLIYAIDTNENALKSLPDSYGNAVIKKMRGNFVTENLALHNLDGILMANSFHYVKDKPAFLAKVDSYLADNACILLVEYDTSIPNNWVPYPQTFSSLQNIFSASGFSSVHKLNEMPSIYNRAKMYAAIIER